MMEQNPKSVSLDDILISPNARQAWNQLARQSAERLVKSGFAAARRETPAGTHASPRLHWRRGHFRNQAYGVKHSERKVIWIEPTLIGADE